MNSTSALLDAIDWAAYERLVVLSPHLDDAVFSCAGLLTAVRERVPALVVTVCSGQPPVIQGVRPIRGPFVDPGHRRREDTVAMQALGCHYVHLGFPDAIDRRDRDGNYLYWDDFIGRDAPHPEDADHLGEVARVVRRLITDLGRVLLVAPLSIGHHVDHLVCADVAAALRGEAGQVVDLAFYEDFPYSVREEVRLRGHGDGPTELARLGLPVVSATSS